jgi:hypothetical protein
MRGLASLFLVYREPVSGMSLAPMKGMLIQDHMDARAGPFVTYKAHSLMSSNHWKAVTVITAAVLSTALFMHSGKAAQLENGVEVAFSQARQLLHEADKENRDVRPLPLSLGKVQASAGSCQPAAEELIYRIGHLCEPAHAATAC